MKKSFCLTWAFLTLLAAAVSCVSATDQVYLTIVPPGLVTDKVDLDVRVGVVNDSDESRDYEISVYLDDVMDGTLLHEGRLTLEPSSADYAGFKVPTSGMTGDRKIVTVVKEGRKKTIVEEGFEVMPSEIRSTELVEGAWIGIYHWSEIEGLHWNSDIKEMTAENWKEMVRAMNSVGMNTIVIQEMFRNEEYVGKHSLTMESYSGKAFYPSDLYPGRMDVAYEDPLEAIMSEADLLGMDVLVGVGMFAWFDFTEESLRWHKAVAEELWSRYGSHDSFYGFYVSEECAGSLYMSEPTPEGKQKRKDEIVDFFREFRQFTNTMAPGKPVMLATNSMGVPYGADTYPRLLEHLDILCPFGFARMPQGDLTGYEAAQMLQKFCDEAGSHLWFDLEAFLFNPDMSLYPRPIDEIVADLTLLDNFEKILCYQFPGVFNAPEIMSRTVGEERTIQLYDSYKAYREDLVSRMSHE
ncbi:MAG: DUF4434 domain-containing protein [Bacteroidales bacterium]|nr:DUF4434 domain-containing protein [Bacteroidales bacterium]